MHVATLLVTALTAASPEPAPWDAGAFTASAAEVARWAAQHPAAPGAPLELLLQEITIRFDAAGRMSSGYRIVFRPLTPAAVEQWGSVSRAWSPWFQEVPLIRARAIHPDGTAHVLDGSTLSQSAAHEDDPQKYADARVLRGPVPGVRAGDVVETESIGLESAPYFDAGRSVRLWVATGFRRVHVRVQAPAAAPLRWKLLGGLDARPVERKVDGEKVLEWELWNVPERAAADELAPPELVGPQIAVGTGTSWSAVAEAYLVRLEGRLAGADLAAQARAAAGDATDRAEVAQRLLDWVSSKVRYTALELGEASIIPTRPADTLARGYGDCKDLSTLLVALLRARGVAAEVAFVRANRLDVVDLPALDDFDHMIVHVPGAAPLWIDPIDPDTPVGELPVGDQGRLALVAVRGTPGLVRLPESAAEVNHLEAERVITMSEAGPARAVLSTRSRGYVAAYERWVARRSSPEELLRKDAGDAAALAPGAVLVTATWKGVERAQDPVESRLELAQAAWGITETETARAVCRPDRMLAVLARRLRTDPADPEMPRDGPPGQDVYLMAAVSGEDRCVVVPPPGFTSDPLPEPLRIARGPVIVERTAEALPDGRVLVRTELLVRARRIEERAARELRAELFPLNRDGVELTFRRTSSVLLHEGKGREALDEIRRLIRLHPAEARHRVHLAFALRGLGMGEAARAAARAAVEREPRNGWTHRALAAMLSTDLLGRWDTPGCDRDGAVAAQRRANELEGDAPEGRAILARYLEMGTRCFRFGAGAQLAEARGLREALRAQGDRTHDEEYLELLLRTGAIEEAAALVDGSEELAKAERRDAARVASVAVAKGAKPAQRELERLGADERRKATDGALDVLVGAGSWEEAAALLRAVNTGSRGSADARAVADALDRVHPGDADTSDPTAPRAVVARLLHAAYAAPAPREALAAVLSEELRDPLHGEPLERITGALLATLRKDAPWLPAWAAPDLAPALFQIDAQGDEAAGYRVRVVARSGSTTTIYVARQGKALRAIAFDLTPGLLGEHAARLVAAGKLEAARRVLGWAQARDESDPARVVEALLEGGDQSAAALALAADALSAYRAAPPREVLDRLAAAQRRAETGERKRALTTALAEGLRTALRWEELLALVGTAGPYANAAFEAQAEALVALRRPKELHAAAEARLARAPGDLAALRADRDAAVLRGDAAEARRLTARILAAAKARPDDFAKAAWTAAFLDPPPEDGLQHARRAAELQESYPSLVALATLHAARGEAADALRVLQQALDRKWGWSLGPEAWLVIGRIEETYGLAEEAKAAYARSGAAQTPGAFEVEELADRWSKRL